MPVRWRRWRLRSIGVVCGLALAVLGVALVATDRQIERFPVQLPHTTSPGTTWLLVGSDSRAFVRDAEDARTFGHADAVTGERADVALLVRVGGGRTRALSLPRDLLLRTANQRPRRLATMWSAGSGVVVGAICRDLGVAIERVAVARFDAFERLVDAVGGIDVTVPRPMRDPVAGLTLTRAGRQRLDGDAALAWVRSRTSEVNDGSAWVAHTTSPAERGRRAEAVLEQVAERATPLHPIRIARVARATSSGVRVDTGADLGDLFRLLRGLRGRSATATLPIEVTGTDVPVAMAAPGARRALAGFARSSACPGTSLRDG